jgi:hypothetical protein
VLTKALAERRRDPAAAVDSRRPGQWRRRPRTPEPDVDPDAGAWPAYLPAADADMTFAPDLVTASLDGDRLKSPMFAAPVEVKSLYEQLDAKLDRAKDGAPIEDAGTRAEPPADEAPVNAAEDRAPPAGGSKEALKDEKDSKKDEKDQKKTASDRQGEDRHGKDTRPGGDKKKAPPKGTRKAAKVAPQAEPIAAPPGPPPLPEIPTVETGPAQLPNEPSLRADPPATFSSPSAPESRPARAAGGKPEPPGRDSLLAIAAFRDAVAAARRLHEELARDSAEAVGRVQAGAERLAELRQRDLEHGLDALSRALGEARMDLDRSADSADQLIAARERSTRARIHAIARAGLGALGGAWGSADKVLRGHSDNKDKAKAAGRGKIGEVERASAAASRKINALVPNREEFFSDYGNALEVAKNEKIKRHLASATKPSAELYDKEAKAEIKSLTATFDQMDIQLEKQFTDIRNNMASTAASSSESLTKVRDSALRQASAKAEELHASVAQARAGGHSALVRQHNVSRRQLIANHRDRGRGEAQAARQRASRGASAFNSLATAQQTGTTALATTLAKEAARPAAEFARVMKSSATSFARQVERTRSDQRPKLLRGAEGGEPAAMAQGQASSARSARTADDMGQRILESAASASAAVTEQVAKGVEPFATMAEPVAETRSSTLASARNSYAGANQKAGEAVVLANGTVANAWEGKGGGNSSDTKDAPPATPKRGEGPGAAEAPAKFVPRADQTAQDPQKNDKGVAGFLTKVRVEIENMITKKAGTIHGHLTAASTPVESVLAELRGITAKQGAALVYQYLKNHHRHLRSHLNSELRKIMSTGATDDANVRAAMNYLNGNHVEGARQEMKAAVNWSNDEGRVERVQRMLTPAELGQLNDKYKDEMEEIVSDLGGNEEKAARALNQIKGEQKGETKDQRERREEMNIRQLGIANAYGLQHDIDQAREKRGEAGGDKTAEAVGQKYQSMGTDILSGFNPLDAGFEDPDVVAKRKERLWKATGEQFEKVVETLPDGTPYKAPPGEKGGLSAIARYASAARNYSEYVPNARGDGGHNRTVSEGLDRHQSELIDAIVRSGPDSEDAAAATIMAELNRKSGPPREDKMRKALGSDMLAAVEGESTEDREKAKKDVTVDGKVIKGTETRARERRDKILRRVGELDASARAAAQPAGEGAKGAPPQPKPPEEVQKQILQTLDTKLANDPTAKAYTRSMVEKLEPDPLTAFEFAIAHEGKNKETLTAATSRMDRDEIDKAVKAWEDKNGRNPSLYAKLGLFEEGKGKGILEGDARNEVELKFMGVPRNDRERAEVASMTTKQQIRDAGIAGPGLAAEEYQRMVTNQNKLLAMMGVTKDDIDAKGRIKLTDRNGNKITGHFDEKGKLVVKDERDREGFETLMQLSTIHADNYKQTVDKIAMGITMALMVIAAVVTTFLTAGGAAAIWGPILITAGAGLVGIGMTAAIRGDRYTTAELQRDLVMTFVQAATAGLGAYAGTALKGAGTAAKAAATAPKVVNAVKAPALSFGAKALNLGKEVLIDSAIGGTTNAINSAAGAAMDPENRRQGKSAEKAFEGGFKGFISGAAGAALTKPMGDAAKRLKGGALGERVASNVAGGFTTRLTEARVGQAMGDPHQSWAESLEVAKEGVVQDVIQAGAEHGAHGAGERRAERKMAARLAAAGEAPAQAAGHPPAHSAADPTGPRPAPEGPPPRLAAPDQAAPQPQAPRPAPPEPVGPQHTPESMARAAAVHEALPPEARSAVDLALPVRPPAPDPAMPPPEPAMLARPAVEEMPAPRAPRPEDAGPASRPARPDEEGAGPRRPVAPEEAEAARKAPPPDQEEAAMLRSAATSDEEPRMRSAFDDDPEKTNPGIRIDPPSFPDGVNLKPGTLESLPEIAIETVVRPVDPTDGNQAKQNYDLMRARQPGKEVLLAYNPETGHYMVIQGGPNSVKPPPEGWITLRHSHPKLDTSDPYHQLTAVLPSGIGGDFHVLRSELDRMPGAKLGMEVSRSSVIDIEVNGTQVKTTFEITRKGANYSLSVTIDPAVHGVSKLGPFHGDRDSALRTYAEKARDATSGGSQFGLNRKPSDKIVMSPTADGPSRVVRKATLAEAERHDVKFVAERMAQAEKFDQQGKGVLPRGEHDPVIAHAATTGDAHARVREMGLVGQPDSLERLTRLLNSSDPTFTPEMRSAVAKATLDATRAELIRTGGLAPGDELLMLFRGVTGGRTDDYHKEGIDLSKLGPGGDEDAGRGLYGSQDFQSAHRYTGEDGNGAVLPLIVRRSELGNVIDVRSGTPLGDRWLAYVRATAGEGRMMPSHPHLSGVLDPRFDVPMGLGRGGRGTRFEQFLASLAADPTLPPAIREAARDPHITLMDLGGVASWGNDRSMLTDQFAMHHQRVADLFNQAHGFPIPHGGSGSGAELRTESFNPSGGKGAGGVPTPPTPLIPEPKTLPHFDRALELALKPQLKELEGLANRAVKTINDLLTPAANGQPHVSKALIDAYIREPDPKLRGHMRDTIAAQLLANNLPRKEVLAARHALVDLDHDLRDYLNEPVRKSIARLPELSPSVVASYILEPSAGARAKARQDITDHLLAQGKSAKTVMGIMRELVALEYRVGDRTRQIAGKLQDGHLAASTDSSIPTGMQRAVDHSPALALLAARDPALFAEIATKYLKQNKAAEAGADAESFFLKTMRAKAKLKSAKNAGIAANAAALVAEMEPMRGGIGDFRGGLAAAIRDVRGPEDLSDSRSVNRREQNFEGRVPLIGEDGLTPGARVDHYEYGRSTVVKVDGDSVTLLTHAGREETINLSDLDTFPALNTNGEEVPKTVPLRDEKEQKAAQDDIDRFRKDESLPEFADESEAGTVSIARAMGEQGVGTNSTLAARTVNLTHEERGELLLLFKKLGLDPQDTSRDPRFVHHGELASLVELRSELRKSGKPMPEVVELFVDRDTCDSCKKNLSIVAAFLGIPELRVYTRGQAAGSRPLIIRAR